MGPMSEGATTEPTVVHTSHSNRLTRGRLSGYPCDPRRFKWGPMRLDERNARRYNAVD